MSLAEFNVTPKKANSDELMEALLACKVGIASPNVLALMCHIAWLQNRVERLGGTIRMSD